MDSTPEPQGPDQTEPGTTAMEGFERDVASERHPLLEIANAMVQIYKEQFGRGPARSRAYYADPDTLVCLLEGTFTPAERNLQAMGEHARVRELRTLFQHAGRARFIEPIERLTGRRVRAFLSGVDTHADVATETFLFEPRTPDPAAR